MRTSTRISGFTLAMCLAVSPAVRAAGQRGRVGRQLSQSVANASLLGTACSKPGIVRFSRGTQVVCTRRARRNVWLAAESRPATTVTTTTAVETYQQPSVASSAAELCKLTDLSVNRLTHGFLASGFPRVEKNFESRGIFTLALIPIDFADLPGDATVMSRVSNQTALVSDWYDMVSDGRVRIEWRVHRTWIRLPGSSTRYQMNRSRSDDNSLAIAALAAADSNFDFTGVRAVAFVLPLGQKFMAEGVQGFKHSEFGSSGGFLTDEGRVENYMIAGAYFEQQWRNFWSYWVHEMGHMFPLPDLYDQNQQWWMNVENKKYDVPGGPFSGFDIMANQDGPSRTLSAWLRFVMGWLTDAQVYCKPLSELTTTEVMLVPIDNRVGGVKAAMIPISPTKILVIESRRPNETFDCAGTGISTAAWRARKGVIVYTADVTLGHGEGFQALVAPAGRGLQTSPNCATPQQLDAVLSVGDVVETNGVRVRVLASGQYDRMEVSRP